MTDTTRDHAIGLIGIGKVRLLEGAGLVVMTRAERDALHNFAVCVRAWSDNALPDDEVIERFNAAVAALPEVPR